ncbi:unnamed protein product [Cuscuta campestris]|uniref:DNA-directed RNA polymerase III subunit RPC4 n=1 Tax=Cuscuta campestris TaxID=132261 RepID=A0A484LW67_9ASTE|nr:unnamed protein product [Cuscuta campestris]
MDPNLPPVRPLTGRKFRFVPKPPPRRAVQQLNTDASRDAAAAEAAAADEPPPDDRLLRRFNEHISRLNNRKSSAGKKGIQFVEYHELAPSAPTRKHESLGDFGNDNKGIFVYDQTVEKKKKEYREPWDYENSYYPTSLPLRKPYSGDPEILDEAEFGEAASKIKHDENKRNASSELGLLDEEPKLLFLQLHNHLPTHNPKEKEPAEVPISAKGKEKVESSAAVRRKGPKKGFSLEELPTGHMGKILVYKSGAVKMKLGDILYDVVPGTEISFPQDVVAIDNVEKSCAVLGGVGAHAVAVPDIDSLLENMPTHID